MSLDASELGAMLAAASKTSGLVGKDGEKLDPDELRDEVQQLDYDNLLNEYWYSVAQAIIKHIRENATVTVEEVQKGEGEAHGTIR